MYFQVLPGLHVLDSPVSSPTPEKDSYFKYCKYPLLPTGIGQCKFNLHRDTEYLPPGDLLAGVIRDTKKATWEEDGMRLKRHFTMLQENCSKTFYRVGTPSYGVASSIKHTIALAWRHWLAGNPVYFDKSNVWKWSPNASHYPPVMTKINDDCVTDHKANFDDHLFTVWDNLTSPNDRIFIARQKKRYHRRNGNWYRTKHGDLLFSAVLAQYFMQPDAATMQSIKQSTRDIATPQPCIAMHMRHGDSCGKCDGYTNCHHHRKCPTFEQYMNKARKMQSLYGINSLFLATDEVITDAMVEYAHSLNFTLSYQNIDRAVYNQNNGSGIPTVENLAENEARLAQEVYIDYYASLQCDMFVGPFHSTMDTLIYETAVGTKGYYPPFISTDDPWCPWEGNNFCPASDRMGTGLSV
jgi:hypothetical protein